MNFTQDELAYLINSVADHCNNIRETLGVAMGLAKVCGCINKEGKKYVNDALVDLEFSLELQRKLWASTPMNDKRSKAEKVLANNSGILKETMEFFENLPVHEQTKAANWN